MLENTESMSTPTRMSAIESFMEKSRCRSFLIVIPGDSGVDPCMSEGRSGAMLKERRRRVVRPVRLTLIAVFFLLLPIANYVIRAVMHDVSMLNPREVFDNIDTLPLILMLAPWLVAVGLFFVRIWGWYAAVVYGMLLLGYNFYALVANPTLYNFFTLSQVIVAALIIYLLGEQDLAAPYFDYSRRGWRGHARKAVRINVSVNGKPFVTSDMSNAGLCIIWRECPLQLNNAVDLNVIPPENTDTSGELLELRGGVARIDGDYIGIAFRGLSRKQRKTIERMLKDTTV